MRIACGLHAQYSTDMRVSVGTRSENGVRKQNVAVLHSFLFQAAFVNMAEQPSSSQGTPAPSGKPLPLSLGPCRRLVAGNVAKRPARGSLVRLRRLPSPEPRVPF